MSRSMTYTHLKHLCGILKPKARFASTKLIADKDCSRFCSKTTANSQGRTEFRRQSLTLATIWDKPFSADFGTKNTVGNQNQRLHTSAMSTSEPKKSSVGIACSTSNNSSVRRASFVSNPSLNSQESVSKCPFHAMFKTNRRLSLQLESSNNDVHATGKFTQCRRHSLSVGQPPISAELLFPEAIKKIVQYASDFGKTVKSKVLAYYHTASIDHSTKASSYSKIPGPRGLPFLGSVLDYTFLGPYSPREFHKALRARHSTYGKIFRERFLSEEFLYVSDPKDVEIIAHNEDSAPCRPHIDAIVESRKQEGYPVGITALQDDEWRRLRSALNPAIMRPKVITNYRPAQEDVTKEFIQFIKNKRSNVTGEVEDFELWISRWALESVAVVLLDTRLGLISDDGEKKTDPIADKLREAMDVFFDYGARLTFGAPVWKVYQTKEWKEFRKAQRDEFEAAGYYVDKKLKTIEKTSVPETSGKVKKVKRPSAASSFLEHIVNNTDLKRDESLTLCLELLAGGIDTSSNAATFALYEMARNPECQEKLRKLIEDDSKNNVEGSSSKSSQYLRACLKEALRLNPLTFANMRKTKKDLVLSGYDVPAGTTVRYTTHLMHLRNAEYFPEPNAFIPDRWISKDSPYRCSQQFVFTPFGHGARQCPGRRIAEQELDLLLRNILANFKVEYHHEDIGTKVRLFNCADKPAKFSFVPLEKE